MKPGSLSAMASAPSLLLLLSGVIMAAIALSIVLLQRNADEELLEQLDRLVRLRSVVAFEPELDRIEREQASGRHDALFMTGGTAAELSARLQSRMNDIASRVGIQVLRSGDIPEASRDGLTLIGADIDLLGTADAIYAVLGEFEQSTPAIVVERLAFRAPMGNAPETDLEQPLSVTLRIYAASRSRGGPGPVP